VTGQHLQRIVEAAEPGERFEHRQQWRDADHCADEHERRRARRPEDERSRGGGDLDRGTAMHKAMRDWSEFTGLEYGAAWGNYAIAANKTMQCGMLRDTWMCETVAVPCKM